MLSEAYIAKWAYKRKISEEKVIKTLIYGVKSSGNQSERGLRETARMHVLGIPEVNHIVQNDRHNIIQVNITKRHCLWDIWPDWQNHTDNSNNGVRITHAGKKRSWLRWRVTWWIKAYMGVSLRNDAKNLQN